jgi:hypothetical protein
MTLRPLADTAISLFLFLPAIFCGGSALAQEKPVKDLPNITAADFTLPHSPAIDSNSSAVILANFGEIHFVGNEHNWFSHVFRVHERIKILNKKAFDDAATVRVSLYTPQDDPEKLDKVTASTFNLENGQLTEIKLDKKDIFQDRTNKDFTDVKWTFPDVREGSIVDFSYTITSNYNTELPAWRFQSLRYPCLFSELQVDIPQTLIYVLFKQGIHPYTVDKGSEGAENYRVRKKGDESWVDVSATTERHHWIMKDIPAFQEEPFLTSDENYVDKIDFQLSRTYDGEQFDEHYNSWKQATEQLLGREDFGGALEDDNPAIDEMVQKTVVGADGLAAQAKAIYYYVGRHFNCDDANNLWVTTSLNDVLKKHTGSVGDINLLLAAMLRKIGLKADPVILSTRENGFNLASYPILRRLNYVVVRVMIHGNIVYLDAAHPELGFGQLDESCYNGHARVISNTDSASVYFEADSLREKTGTVVFIMQGDNGAEGTWTSTLGPERSYNLRKQIAAGGLDGYFKNIQASFGDDVAISDEGIDSIDRPEDPVKIHYSFKLRQDSGAAMMYVNPFIGAGVRENPFKAADRRYPVEMTHTSDDQYVFSFQIPAGYTVTELPKSTRATLNGQDGSFEYLAGADAGMVQVRCHLKLNKATFSADDYSSLRNFFSLVVSKEAEAIVLKKN